MNKLLIMMSTFFSHILIAQDTLQHKPFVYRITVSTNINNKEVSGYLNSLTDTSVNISPYAVSLHNYASNPSRSTQIPFSNITFLSIKRAGGAGRGAFIGGIAGALTGALAGFAAGDDHPEGWNFFSLTAGQKAGLFGTLAGVAGATIGALAGAAIQQTFLVKGRKEKFHEFQMSVAK